MKETQKRTESREEFTGVNGVALTLEHIIPHMHKIEKIPS